MNSKEAAIVKHKTGAVGHWGVKPRLAERSLAPWLLLGLGGLLIGAPGARAENLDQVRQLLQTNVCENCDLSNATLSSVDLRGADLSGANLQGANLRAVNLMQADLSNAALEGADLTGADLRGANLQGTNLAEAILGQTCSLNDLGFSQADCQMLNLVQQLGPQLCDDAYGLAGDPAKLGLFGEFCGGNPSESSLLYFSYGLLGLSSGIGQLLRGPALMGADLRGANLSGLDLEGADLRYVQLPEANLEGTQLTYALLIGADIRATNGDFSQAFLAPADVGRLLGPLLQEEARARIDDEGRSYTGAMNRAQQAYHLERGMFASKLEDLDLGIEAESEYYRYAIAQVTPNYVVNTAVALEPDAESYLGLVYRVPDREDYLTKAILCVTPETFTQLPAIPPTPAVEEPPTCPEGFRPFNF
ncbi:MAG TPA: pentapeptide repeat-containing protein [Trichocoleus sp.]